MLHQKNSLMINLLLLRKPSHRVILRVFIDESERKKFEEVLRAYKKYLGDGHVRHINDAASDLEKKYQEDKVVLQFIWYQKASWSGIVEQIKEWS